MGGAPPGDHDVERTVIEGLGELGAKNPTGLDRNLDHSKGGGDALGEKEK